MLPTWPTISKLFCCVPQQVPVFARFEPFKLRIVSQLLWDCATTVANYYKPFLLFYPSWYQPQPDSNLETKDYESPILPLCYHHGSIFHTCLLFFFFGANVSMVWTFKFKIIGWVFSHYATAIGQSIANMFFCNQCIKAINRNLLLNTTQGRILL